MSRTTALRAFLAGAPLAFAALLTQHPEGEGDMYTAVAADVTPWLAVHFGAAVLFPLMALVVTLLIRDVRSHAATVARFALPAFAVLYGVWEALFGIATGILADTGNDLSGARRQGVIEAFDDVVAHPMVGNLSVFNSVGSIAWVIGISAAIVALKQAGVRRAALVLLGVGSLMVMHVPPFGPVALVCLSGATILIERGRTARAAAPMRLAPAS